MKNLSYLLALLLSVAAAFSPQSGYLSRSHVSSSASVSTTRLFQSNNQGDGAEKTLVRSRQEDELEKTFGGYTVKQRLREEIESPFRTIRLFLFGSSTGSALVALYFSATNALKATMYDNASPSLDDSLQSCVINLVALVVCAAITYRDWQAGEANLSRIAKGGALAKLLVTPAGGTAKDILTVKDYRRTSRLVIAAGGKEYIETMCRSLCSDQRADENMIPTGLESSDLIVIPVLLQGDGFTVGDTSAAWSSTEPSAETDRNFDSTRADNVLAFPRGNAAWADYLKSEVETAKSQGFDVLQKGITITVKKNGRILRRATGQPPWGSLIGTMEVLDGSKFGMPGDDERYGS